ncbi:citrate (Si)-synthase [Spizellomyces punctatus DAOM BR117]|uniref:Citrate synthase n=1 Tax=Spizellomyces punctatus (strain DAOM BR117) TaxID=645134 RepID=A0A0L0HGP2_SPIPD|nr:citrate (Si)-synthase [Spizellomyces punctatus DAOM BR117]KND00222.1 citrate (Si)-synthase [Spizellomyces punctatus DAOM BR117]|eukprot:XP_016608261.1 citrate (Si)-synthase [Spizellomyces punctatus DAOM BR117]
MLEAKARIDAIAGHLAGSDDLVSRGAKVAPVNKAEATQFTLTDRKSGQTFEIAAGPDTNQPTSFVLLSRRSNANTLTVLDNRTGKTYEVPIEEGTIKATDFQKIKEGAGPGIRIYDPAYQNTAVARSKICEIDGDKGILRYRGYPIEELAEKSNFLEVSYLLIYGELPSKTQYDAWTNQVMRHTFIHTRVQTLMQSFNYDAHPMGMFISSVAAMSTFHPEANPALAGNEIYKKDSRVRNKQILRLMGKVPTVAASCYRHRIGRHFNNPRNDLSYTENFLYMMDYLSEENYKPNPKLAKALDVLFILHADHELNCSTAAMRHIGSSLVDPYSAVAGAASALYGPLHGGANEAVLRMLEEIGSVDNVAPFLEQVKQRKRKLMGFGHRVYKNYDPRAKIIRRIAYEVFDVCGKEPLIEVAIELEKRALSDEFFTSKKLYPNVDFYSGLIYKAMGFPTDFFPVLFAIPRVAGWLAHWVESLEDPDAKIWRPRQVYTGEGKRSYVPLGVRDVKSGDIVTDYESHPFSKRSQVASFERKS